MQLGLLEPEPQCSVVRGPSHRCCIICPPERDGDDRGLDLGSDALRDGLLLHDVALQMQPELQVRLLCAARLQPGLR